MKELDMVGKIIGISLYSMLTQDEGGDDSSVPPTPTQPDMPPDIIEEPEPESEPQPFPDEQEPAAPPEPPSEPEPIDTLSVPPIRLCRNREQLAIIPQIAEDLINQFLSLNLSHDILSYSK